jgi:hypothetical protein
MTSCLDAFTSMEHAPFMICTHDNTPMPLTPWGSRSQNFMPKSYTNAKSLPCGAKPTKHIVAHHRESLFKMCLLDLVKAYVSPRVFVLHILTNTEKQIKLSLPKDTTLSELLHN